MLDGLQARALAESDGPRMSNQRWMAFSACSSTASIGPDVIRLTMSLQDNNLTTVHCEFKQHLRYYLLTMLSNVGTFLKCFYCWIQYEINITLVMVPTSPTLQCKLTQLIQCSLPPVIDTRQSAHRNKVSKNKGCFLIVINCSIKNFNCNQNTGAYYIQAENG